MVEWRKRLIPHFLIVKDAIAGNSQVSMGEVFPADDPIARWLVTMSVGLNDVVFATGLPRGCRRRRRSQVAQELRELQERARSPR